MTLKTFLAMGPLGRRCRSLAGLVGFALGVIVAHMHNFSLAEEAEKGIIGGVLLWLVVWWGWVLVAAGVRRDLERRISRAYQLSQEGRE